MLCVGGRFMSQESLIEVLITPHLHLLPITSPCSPMVDVSTDIAIMP